MAAASGLVAKKPPSTPKDVLDRLPKLTKAQRNRLLQGESGTAFDLYTRMFVSFNDGSVFETGEWHARDLEEMLKRDGDGIMLEQALTLPLMAATYSFEGAKGDTGELDLVQEQLQTPSYAGGLTPNLSTIVGQMAAGTYNKKAFFEKEWTNPEGNVVKLESLNWRPPDTCEVMRDADTAKMIGFRQRAWWFAQTMAAQKDKFGKNWDGYIRVYKPRAFVFIHGQHRQPLTGTSDLDVTYWCYKQKQKILFLWFQFLEQQSLPKIAAYGPDPDAANIVADTIASMKSSGVAGFQRPPQGAKLFDVIAGSGAGAEQFQQALQFLQSYQSRSVLAGFLELGNAAALGRGSYALSESQSDFFLKHREAAKTEITDQFTESVVAPLCVLNFGSEAKIPTMTSSPLSQTDSAQIVGLLQAGMSAPKLNVPPEFLDLVASKVGTIFNLDPDKVTQILSKASEYRAQQAALASPMGASPEGQGAAKIAGTADAASKLAAAAGGGRAA